VNDTSFIIHVLSASIQLKIRGRVKPLR